MTIWKNERYKNTHLVQTEKGFLKITEQKSEDVHSMLYIKGEVDGEEYNRVFIGNMMSAIKLAESLLGWTAEEYNKRLNGDIL